MPLPALLRRLTVLLPLLLLPPAAAGADEAPLANRPFPTLDADMHTAVINRFAVDRAGRYGVSASDDKTARVWDLQARTLLRTLRVPIGPDKEGQLYAVAISPDGSTVALGGWTSAADESENIYFFDRASGRLTGRVAGLPNVIKHLAWSPDGRRLAVALGGSSGVRLYAAQPPYAELARDAAYTGSSYSIEFDRNGRLVSTCEDGKLRLYDANLRLLVPPRPVAGGADPFSARFSPDGSRIAVGFNDSTAVTIVSGTDLTPRATLDTHEANKGNLGSVTWSADGRRLYAAGSNDLPDGQNPVRVFDPASGRELAAWPVSTDTVMDLQALGDGRLVFATADPAWGIVGADGRMQVRHSPPVADHRGNAAGFRLSAGGDRVGFIHETWQNDRWQSRTLSFDLRTLALGQGELPPGADLRAPRSEGLPINDWQSRFRPTLAGQPLRLKNNEISRSLAIAADGSHFALGTNWYIRWFTADGKQRWAKSAPGTAWLVNTSADGRFVVGGFGDGTIRWYRTADRSEALALFVHADGERWVAWTPEGFFAASSPKAETLMGYTLNQGRDKEAEYVSSAQLRDLFYRPDLIAKRIDGDEAAIAAALEATGNVREVLAGGLAPEIELRSDAKAEVSGEYLLKLNIVPRAGGIGRVSLRVNGVEQSAGRDPAPMGGIYQQPLNYTPGGYKLEVAVYGAGNRLLSKSVAIDLQVRGVAERPRLHVVAVGVSKYYDPALRDGVSYAADDARALVDTLRTHADTEVLDMAPPVLLQEQSATRDNIVAALQALARDARPQDLVVVFLAGHGSEDNGDYFYQPWETRYTSGSALLAQSLSGKRLRDLLLEVKVNKALVLLDTCASGKFTLVARGPGEKDAVDRFARLSGRAVISASAGKAREHDKLSHGLFTDALLRGLAGAADRDGNRRVEVGELADFIEKDVEAAALRLFNEPQLPQRELNQHNFPVSRRR